MAQGTVDPFTIRAPKSEERFFQQNFDFQNLLTIQNKELKKMFLSESGISEYISTIMASIDESYTIQKYETMREMISKAINSTNTPLQASQKIELPKIDESSSYADMSKFIQAIQNIYDLMQSTVVSGKFNASKYEHGLYPDDYVLLVRADIWNIIKTTLMANTFHNDTLGVNFKVRPVKDFGGITYSGYTPIYDDLGVVTNEPTDSNAVVDPNAKTMAVLIQKGTIFTTTQQPYQTSAIYNPAGLYTNFWASQPNSSFNYDSCYDIITFNHG